MKGYHSDICDRCGRSIFVVTLGRSLKLLLLLYGRAAAIRARAPLSLNDCGGYGTFNITAHTRNFKRACGVLMMLWYMLTYPVLYTRSRSAHFM